MIRGYRNSDFEQIHKITQRCWKNEVDMDLELENFIYDFLIHYYLSNETLTLVNEDDGSINAFLISSTLSDKNNAMQLWNERISVLKESNQCLAKQYLEYLEYNHQKVVDCMSNESIYLGLIASVKPHMGGQLIKRLKEIALQQGLKDIYLWTDETCNYKYYEKNNFKLIETYSVILYGKTLKTFIYKTEV